MEKQIQLWVIFVLSNLREVRLGFVALSPRDVKLRWDNYFTWFVDVYDNLLQM